MKWLWLLGLVAASAVAALLLDPTHVLWGKLRGEEFYQGRPVSYWRRAILSEDPKTQLTTAQAFEEGGAQTVPVLIELLRADVGADWNVAKVRWTAANYLGKLGTQAQAAGPALVRACKDDDAGVRKVAIAALPAVGADAHEAVPGLRDLLSTSDRLYATQALRFFGPAALPALSALVPLLTDADAEVRWQAAWTLGRIGPAAREAVPALKDALKDPEDKVREHAAEALGDIGPEARNAVPALIQTLNDSNAGVRRDAVRSLGQIGPAAKEALPAINRLLKDDSPRVREAAGTAVKRITTAPPTESSSPKKEDDD
jgi:HEAT repeat protein